jgi:hypothetical protein
MDHTQKLLVAYRFSVNIDNTDYPFAAISGLKMDMAFEPLQVGGLNDGPVMLPIPSKDAGRATFSKGKISNPAKPLPRPGMPLKDVSITTYNADFTTGNVFSLEAPVLESIELAGFDAYTSEILIETFTISFRNIKELT